MPPNRKVTDILVNHVAFLRENRESTFAAQTKQFESSSRWLADAILSCKRKVMAGASDVLEEPSKRAKADMDKPAAVKEKSQPNISKDHVASDSIDESERHRIMSLKVVELRNELRLAGLATTGLKGALRERLLEHVASCAESVSNSSDAKRPDVRTDEVVASACGDRNESNEARVDVVDVDMVDVSDEKEKDATTASACDFAMKPEDIDELEESAAPMEVDAPSDKCKLGSSTATSLLKATKSLFSPGNPVSKNQTQSSEKEKPSSKSPKSQLASMSPLRTAIAQGDKKTASAVSSPPSRTMPEAASSSENSRPKPTNEKPVTEKPAPEQSKPNSTGDIQEEVTTNQVSSLKAPVTAPTPILSVHSVPTSLKAKQKKLADARKARLAEIRGKSKPVALPKTESSTETPSLSATRTLKASALKNDKDEKRLLLTAQMREKAAASAKPQTIAPAAKPVVSSVHQTGSSLPQSAKPSEISPAKVKAQSTMPQKSAPTTVKSPTKVVTSVPKSQVVGPAELSATKSRTERPAPPGPHVASQESILADSSNRARAAAAPVAASALKSLKVASSASKTAVSSQPSASNNPHRWQTKLRLKSSTTAAASGATPTGAKHRDIKFEHRDKLLSPMDTYEISDRETDSDSSDDESDHKKPKKKIPEWALKKNLLPALERQYDPNEKKLNPDFIFPEVETCNLEAIFGKKKDRYKSRTSSGNWSKDRVTATEKLVYSRSMGYAES